jgi:hypothetical protein
MNPTDKDKLNQCISLLESTDLFPSLVWLWTWDVVKSILGDAEYKVNVTEEQMWGHLCEAVENGMGFSMEFGSESLHEDIREWMLEKEYISDPYDEDDDE